MVRPVGSARPRRGGCSLAGGSQGNPELEGECLAALVWAGALVARQVGQCPRDPEYVVGAAGAYLPEVDGPVDGGEGFGWGQVGAAQLGSGDAGVEVPGCLRSRWRARSRAAATGVAEMLSATSAVCGLRSTLHMAWPCSPGLAQ